MKQMHIRIGCRKKEVCRLYFSDLIKDVDVENV